MVRRTLNWRFLLVTAGISAASLVVLYLLHGWQIRRTADGLLALAELHEQKSGWQKSAEYLDHYLNIRPDDTAVRIRLAQLYARGAQTPAQKKRATELLYRALATGDQAAATGLRCELADLLIEMDRPAEAERQVRLVLDGESKNLRANRALALALAGQLADGSFAGQSYKELKIIESVEEAQQLNPDDLRLAAMLATLLRDYPTVVQAERPTWNQSRRELEADASLDRYLQEFPQSAEGRLARARYRLKYKLPGAAEDLDDALRIAPDDAEILFAVAANKLNQAQQLQRSGDDAPAAEALLRQSQQHFEHLIAKTADIPSSQAQLGLGDARLALRDLDGALATWQEGVEQLEQPTTRLEFYGRIADACLSNNRLSDVDAALDAGDEILAKLGGSIPQQAFLALARTHDLRRAHWHVQCREPMSALALLRLVLAGQPTGEGGSPTTFLAWHLLGTAHSELNEWADAATAFDRAATIQPNVQSLRLAAAKAWLLAGRPDASRERAEQANAVAATGEAWLAVAVAELQVQRLRSISERDWSRLDDALRALEKCTEQQSSPLAWRAAFLKAESLVLKDQVLTNAKSGRQQAIELLLATDKRHGDDREFLRQVCFVYQALRFPAEADRALAALRRIDSGAETSLVEARLLSLRGDDAAAKKILQQAINTAPPQLVGAVRAELLRATLASKDWAQGRAMLLQEHQRNPEDVAVIRRLAEVDLERNDLRGVETWEQQLVAAGPTGVQLARYYRAWRLFRSVKDSSAPELRDALAELEQVAVAQPNWAEATTLKAMTLQRLGRLEQAAADYERAINGGDRRVVVFEQLIALLDRLHRPADVERYLARLGGDAPLSQWLTEFASTHEMRHERPDRALEIARKNAERLPDDSAAQLWLGRLLLVANQPDAAEVSLCSAVELEPANSAAWSALVGLYRRAEDQTQLQASLVQLQSNTGIDPAQKNLLIGQIQQALGKHQAAQQSFARAAAQDGNSVATQLRVAHFYLSTAPAKAIPYLEAALRITPDSKAARQMLAVANAASGDLAAVENLLSSANDDATAAAEDARLHALLRVQRGGAANLERAVKLLEELVSRPTGVLPLDRSLLARLYEQQATGISDAAAKKAVLDRAEHELIAVARSEEANPLHLAALCQFYVRQQRASDAATWLAKLETKVNVVAKDDPNAIAVVIETQIGQQAADRSKSWLARLEKLEPLTMRPAALRARVAVQQNADAEVEPIIEPQMKRCLERAKTPDERQQLYAAAGNLYRELQRQPSAERWLRTLLAEAPQHYPALVSVLVEQRRMPEVIELCEAAAKTDETPQAAMVLASALVEGQAGESEFVRAEPILSAATARFDEDEKVLYGVALVRILKNESREAAVLLRRVIAANPRHIHALNNLAMVLSETPDGRDEALRLIDQAIEIAGPNAGLLDTKGTILIYSGRSAQAVSLLEKATQAADADPRHHFHLALAYHDTGRTADAKSHMQIALDRELVSQILTSTDRKLLANLLGALQLSKPVSTPAVTR